MKSTIKPSVLPVKPINLAVLLIVSLFLAGPAFAQSGLEGSWQIKFTAVLPTNLAGVEVLAFMTINEDGTVTGTRPTLFNGSTTTTAHGEWKPAENGFIRIRVRLFFQDSANPDVTSVEYVLLYAHIDNSDGNGVYGDYYSSLRDLSGNVLPGTEGEGRFVGTRIVAD